MTGFNEPSEPIGDYVTSRARRLQNYTLDCCEGHWRQRVKAVA